MMGQEPADLVLTRRTTGLLMTPSDQVAWLHAMRVPLRSISIDPSLFRAHHAYSDFTASTELAVSADMLAASTCYLQVGKPGPIQAPAPTRRKRGPVCWQTERTDGSSVVCEQTAGGIIQSV